MTRLAGVSLLTIHYTNTGPYLAGDPKRKEWDLLLGVVLYTSKFFKVRKEEREANRKEVRGTEQGTKANQEEPKGTEAGTKSEASQGQGNCRAVQVGLCKGVPLTGLALHQPKTCMIRFGN